MSGQRPRPRRGRQTTHARQPTRISYEVVPGQWFAKPKDWARSSYGTRAAAQHAAQEMFEADVLNRVGLPRVKITSEVSAGGWKGEVNPSGQVLLDPAAERGRVLVAAALFGLIWRQDAVLVTRLHPDGAKAAVLVYRTDGKKFTKAAIQKAYETLYNQDSRKQATLGFMEVDGAMLFINGSDLSDDEFRQTIRLLVERHLPGEVRLRHLQADLEEVSTDWSDGRGEDYRRRVREAGRPDLLEWVDRRARPEAERFIETFDWKAGQARRQDGAGEQPPPGGEPEERDTTR